MRFPVENCSNKVESESPQSVRGVSRQNDKLININILY